MRLFLITKVTFEDEKVIMVSDDTEEEVKDYLRMLAKYPIAAPVDEHPINFDACYYDEEHDFAHFEGTDGYEVDVTYKAIETDHYILDYLF